VIMAKAPARWQHRAGRPSNAPERWLAERSALEKVVELALDGTVEECGDLLDREH
jgi:hypothetical protein